MQQKKMLEVKDLYTNYGSIQALKGINLEVFEGEIVTLIGNNGAGKSTALSRSRVRRRDFCFLPEIFSTILLKNRPFFLYNSQQNRPSGIRNRERDREP